MSAYLQMQVDAGADAVQLFDSWAGILSVDDFVDFATGADLLVYECSGTQQFLDQQPWGTWHIIPEALADLATQIDAARLLTWRAADLANQGKACANEASMAKAFAADVAHLQQTPADLPCRHRPAKRAGFIDGERL